MDQERENWEAGAPSREAGQAPRDADRTTAYLLVQLRKANRRILRLRAVALAARDGRPDQLRGALARLKAGDLDPA
jgi:hypothetical protein